MWPQRIQRNPISRTAIRQYPFIEGEQPVRGDFPPQVCLRKRPTGASKPAAQIRLADQT